MSRRKRKSPVEKIAALLARARARSLSGMLECCGDNPAVNKRFTSEQSCFAGARIVCRPTYEIESSRDATRTVTGADIAYCVTHIQPCAVIMKGIGGASVGGDKCTRGKAQRYKPLRIVLF